MAILKKEPSDDGPRNSISEFVMYYVYAVMYGTTFRTSNRATSPRIIWSLVTSCVRTQHRTLCSTVILGCTSTIAAHV